MLGFFKKISKKRKNTVKVNGKTYIFENDSNSIKVLNGNVFINGREIIAEDEKKINIEIFGYVDKVEVGSCNDLRINGDVKTLNTKSGSAYVNGNTNSVSTISGNVCCRVVHGSVSTVSGDVKTKI